MHIFCNKINVALKQNFIFLDLCFKKKYIDILYKLLEFNLIKSFNFNKKIIRIFFRYYNNKPVFFLDCEVFSSCKKFYKLQKIKKIYKNENDFIDFYSTNSNISSISCKRFMLLKNIGGLKILKINLLFD